MGNQSRVSCRDHARRSRGLEWIHPAEYHHRAMGRGAIFFAMLVGSLAIACGDPPLCPGETVILIDRAPVIADTDLVEPGVQTEIVVQTSLAAGVELVLEVIDIGGAVIAEHAGTVDGNG